MGNVSWIGQTISGRYRIEALLGQGGMSSVYKASDPNLRRTVAIKMIHPHLSSNPSFISRFEEEAAIVAQLRHENIIQVYDFNHDGDVYYMVLEFIPGETLEERLKRLNARSRRMDVAEVTRMIAQVCDAVSYAHEHGMIHRDIKPANIMLDVYGKAILMDFGIARMVGGQMHTAAGAVVGTAMYMAPEQIRGERADERSDIYSLGVTLFEALTGKPPFEADSAMTLMMMHLNDPVPDIHELQPDVNENLARVVKKALEKKREDRFQSAAEMAAALRSAYDRMTGVMLTPAEPVDPLDNQPYSKQSQAEMAHAGHPVERTLVEPPAPLIKNTLRKAPVPDQQEASGATAGAAAAAQPEAAAGPPTDPILNPHGEPAAAESAAVEAASPVVRPARFLSPAVLVGGALLLVIFGVVAFLFAGLPLLMKQGAAATPTTGSAAAAISATSGPTGTALAPTTASTTSPAGAAAAGANPAASTATVPANQPSVRINTIGLDKGHYVVDYQTTGFTEKLPGMNIHFFFNTVPPDQAGVPGKGPYMPYGGPTPFRGFSLANLPQGATQICALVANPDNTVIPNSGNCVDLPQ